MPLSDSQQLLPLAALMQAPRTMPPAAPTADAPIAAQPEPMPAPPSGFPVDYHRNIDFTVYEWYLRNRVLNSRRPGERIVFVIDNASYHCRRPIMSGNLVGMRKAQAIDKIIELKSSKIDQANSAALASLADSERSRLSSMRMGNIIAELRQLVKGMPTVVESLLAEVGGRVLYTPPRACELQPIEMLWASAKGYVARHYHEGRSMEETRQLLHRAFEDIGRGFAPGRAPSDLADDAPIPEDSLLSRLIAHTTRAESAASRPSAAALDQTSAAEAVGIAISASIAMTLANENHASELDDLLYDNETLTAVLDAEVQRIVGEVDGDDDADDEGSDADEGEAGDASDGDP